MPWNVFQGQLVRVFNTTLNLGTIFVPKGHATTLTMGSAIDSNANSSTNVQNASNKAIHNANATLQGGQQIIILHPQLQEQLFTPVTPVRYKVLDTLLKDHPNRDKVNYVLQGFRVSFSLKYTGLLENRQPKIYYQHTSILQNYGPAL